MSVSTASKTDKDIQDPVEKELNWTRQVEDSANIGVAVSEGVVRSRARSVPSPRRWAPARLRSEHAVLPPWRMTSWSLLRTQEH